VTPAGSRWSGLEEGTQAAVLPEMQTRGDLSNLRAAAGTA
jgi:hypothetical protein